MLTFVGLGLYDERSVTIEGREAIRAADRWFTEAYTSRLMGTTIEALGTFHGVEIEELDREAVEQGPEELLDAAEAGAIAFLVVGDPMISTTHVDLRLRAHRRGIDTQIVHGTSAATAVAGLTGLQNYRFGRATTLPFPAGRGVPPSVVDVIEGNLERGLHTLVYLDIDTEGERFLTADAAARHLAEPCGDPLGVAVARAGSPDPLVAADRLSALATREFGGPLHLIVIPGSLHRMEAEALLAFANAPEELAPVD